MTEIEGPGGNFLWIPRKDVEVPHVEASWGREERRGRILCRLSNRFRMHYTVEPGLYAVGRPAPESPVLVTANYRLSFDLLRRELTGMDAWVLVLDTRGINVWCAAGKGTFGTGELIRKVQEVNLAERVSHRRLILPQLGAPGVRAHAVREATGFSVSFGPVRAADLAEYLRAGGKATADMRAVRFGVLDRLELTPMEVLPALRHYPWILLGIALLFGLTPRGILFLPALSDGWPYAALGLAVLLSGGFLTPLLLPWIPFRAFALKGWFVGVLLTGGFLVWRWESVRESLFLLVLTVLFFPLISSYTALLFTGSTPFTGISGVKKEMMYALPLYVVALGLSAAAAVLYLVRRWGFL
jgi:hypothetical protein